MKKILVVLAGVFLITQCAVSKKKKLIKLIGSAHVISMGYQNHVETNPLSGRHAEDESSAKVYAVSYNGKVYQLQNHFWNSELVVGKDYGVVEVNAKAITLMDNIVDRYGKSHESKDLFQVIGVSEGNTK